MVELMSVKTLYQASPLKRHRRTKAELLDFKTALAAIVDEIKPCTVRQCFYQASVRGVCDKTETGYGQVQRALVELRRDCFVPYASIVDHTRYMLKPATYDSVSEFLEITAQTYRRAVWTDLPDYVECWLEKDALRGVLSPVTLQYDVPLMVARGYASLSFLHGSAEAFRWHTQQGKTCHLIHLGDFDPSGVNAAEKIRDTIQELAPEIDLHFTRLAVTEKQIAEWNLPTRPTKKSDTRAKNWSGGDSVELDAIHPDQLRKLLSQELERFVPDRLLSSLQAAENSERDVMRSWAGEL
jgi:hypothetical protein